MAYGIKSFKQGKELTARPFGRDQTLTTEAQRAKSLMLFPPAERRPGEGPSRGLISVHLWFNSHDF